MYQIFKNDKYYSGYIKRLIKMEYAMYDYRDKDFKDIKRIHYDSDSNQDN